MSIEIPLPHPLDGLTIILHDSYEFSGEKIHAWCSPQVFARVVEKIEEQK